MAVAVPAARGQVSKRISTQGWGVGGEDELRMQSPRHAPGQETAVHQPQKGAGGRGLTGLFQGRKWGRSGWHSSGLPFADPRPLPWRELHVVRQSQGPWA